MFKSIENQWSELVEYTEKNPGSHREVLFQMMIIKELQNLAEVTKDLEKELRELRYRQ